MGDAESRRRPGPGRVAIAAAFATAIAAGDAAPAAAGDRVQVQVGTVYATNAGRHFDQDLDAMRAQFERLFRYTSYRLVKRESRGLGSPGGRVAGRRPAAGLRAAPEGTGASRDRRSVVDRGLDPPPDEIDVDSFDRVRHAFAEQALDPLASADLRLARTAVSDVHGGLAHRVAIELAVEVPVEQFLGFAAVQASSCSRFCSFLRA